MTAAPPRRFDDPAPPSSLAAAGLLMRARWGVCLALIVASAIAIVAAVAVVSTGALASATLGVAIAATPIVAVVAADATAADTAAVGAAIRALPDVASATLRSKDDALRALSAAGTPVPDGRNPLPDVWLVMLDAGPIVRGAETVTQSATALRASIARVPNVETVRVDDRWLAPLADRTARWQRTWPVVQGSILFALAVAVGCCSFLAGRAMHGTDERTAPASKWALAIVAVFAAVSANLGATAAVYATVANAPSDSVGPVITWLGRGGGGMAMLGLIALASSLLVVAGMTLPASRR